MHVQLNYLKLMYPPISNQEAEWIKDDPIVKDQLKTSRLYMIGQRHEAKFLINYENAIDNNGRIDLEFCSNGKTMRGYIDVGKLLQYRNYDISDKNTDIEIELGEKLIRFWIIDSASEEKIDVLDWFPTEKFLWDKGRNHPALVGFEEYREFTKYYLHYVGISKKEDSLTRLMVRPHDKRLRILSNEHPMNYGSRPTDEIVLFFFEIRPLQLTTFDEGNFDSILNPNLYDDNVVADAEKAFVNLLRANYNEVTYQNYPKGSDGLYSVGLDRYGYIIGESIELITDQSTIRGDFHSDEILASSADMIFIEGDNVQLIKYDGLAKDQMV